MNIGQEGQNRAQEEEIPLSSVLKHFMEKKEEMSKFTMIGFQMSKRNLRNRKIAYGRKHVFTAFILNLQKTQTISYTEKAWAMEDVDFNLKVNDLWNSSHANGVIVKCQRFIASKKRLDGGILPRNVPPEIEALMRLDLDWKKTPIARTKRSIKNLNTANQGLSKKSRGLSGESVISVENENKSANM